MCRKNNIYFRSLILTDGSYGRELLRRRKNDDYVLICWESCCEQHELDIGVVVGKGVQITSLLLEFGSDSNNYSRASAVALMVTEKESFSLEFTEPPTMAAQINRKRMELVKSEQVAVEN